MYTVKLMNEFLHGPVWVYFDSHGMPCWFDHVKEKQEAPKMLGLIQKIIDRLNEINDGSFVIDDCETERLNSL